MDTKLNATCLIHIVIFTAVAFALTCGSSSIPPRDTTPINQRPQIDPDYIGVTIPPNIAPLNFLIEEEGMHYFVKIAGSAGKEIVITSHDGSVNIPAKKWTSLLKKNHGQDFDIKIYIKKENGTWLEYQSIINTIAAEKIDPYLAYRIIDPGFKYWNEMGIYQRHLETFDEEPVVTNRLSDGNCMNCHHFANNNPKNMIFHMRGGKGSGTYISQDGTFTKVSLKTDFNRGGAYPSWHPSGKMLAFSVNDLTMFYHSTGECRDVLDRNSDVFIYHVDKNMVSASPKIADEKLMESWPSWSPDGKHLYFCRANELREYISKDNGEQLEFDEIKYDLMRVQYDYESDSWGQLETMVNVSDLKKSVIIPRVSPDGKYVLFCVSDYGSFPIYHKNSELYFLDTKTGEYWPLSINSHQTDSFHSWSSNARWFVFSSKRRDGLFARPYFSYVDENGQTHKPFILPQKDPAFYKTYLKTYNVPEMIKGPVKTRAQEIIRVAYDNEDIRNAQLDPKVKPRKQNTGGESLYESKPQS